MASAPGSSIGDRLLHPESIWDRVVRWGIFCAALAAIIGVAGSAWYYLVWPLRVIFPPVALALVVVYLLNPLVNRLQRRGVRRGLAVALIYVAFVAVVTTALSLLIPLIARQISGFIEKLPTYVQDVTDWVNRFAARRGWDFRIDLTTEKIQQYVTDNRQAIIGVLGGVKSFAFSLIHILITLIIGIILSIYILLDLPKIQRSVRAMLPENRRDEIVGLTEKIGGALGGFFRGQLLVALFVGVASAVGLSIVGIPFAVVVGLIAGIFNLVPLIGPFVGAVPAVILALLSDKPGNAIWAGLVLLIVQQIDNHIISPNVMGRTVKLHPITVMLALLAAGSLVGIFGMLLIIPAIAAVKAVAQHLWSKRTVRDALADAYPGSEAPALFAESVVVEESVGDNGEEVVVEETTVVTTAGDGKGGRRPRAKRPPSRGSRAATSRKRSR
ncbi:MAG: AI-2E family transporter [Actinomycetota bacterium]